MPYLAFGFRESEWSHATDPHTTDLGAAGCGPVAEAVTLLSVLCLTHPGTETQTSTQLQPHQGHCNIQASSIFKIGGFEWVCVLQKILYDANPASYMPGSGFCFRISRVSTFKKNHLCSNLKPSSFSIIPCGLKMFSLSPIYGSVLPFHGFQGNWSRESFRPNLGTLM